MWADLCQEGSQDCGNSEGIKPVWRSLEDSREEEASGLGMVGKEEFFVYKGGKDNLLISFLVPKIGSEGIKDFQ